MQIKYLHPSIYKAYRLLRPLENSLEGMGKEGKPLLDWSKLKRKGLSDEECAEITGISRSTYYRKRLRFNNFGVKGLARRSRHPHTYRQSKISKEVIAIVLAIRKEHPTYGKAKITVILRKENQIILSESSVGRILSKAIKKGQISKYHGLKTNHRRRVFKGHAKRLDGRKAEQMGSLIQMDHMVTTIYGQRYFHFQAIDPISRFLVSEIYTGKTSQVAARFLEKVKAEMPFNLSSIQVDGGSEFMKSFEEKCKNDGIDLFVIPPASPKINGKVERVNRTMREDFYRTHHQDMGVEPKDYRAKLQEIVSEYNYFRPHAALGLKTPAECVNIIKEKGRVNLSHML